MKLISFALCPYAQRVSIALDEKGQAFERVNIDLSNKPDWFTAISPHGKVPVLLHDGQALFESVAILEYLEDILSPSLYPIDPVDRARARAWIAFAGEILGGIGRFYSAGTAEDYKEARAALRGQFERLEEAVTPAPWFSGPDFGMVDAVYASVFRYFDLFDRLARHGVLDGLDALGAWREALAERPSVKRAVAPSYVDDLQAFLVRRQSYLVRAIAA